VGGNAEVVHRSEAGLVLAANTPQAIAEAVQDLLAAPPPRKATRAYAECFGWEATSEGQMMVFEGALLRSGRGCTFSPRSSQQAPNDSA
jgi:glycosyltransferase involved in cell wall biosynthesis